MSNIAMLMVICAIVTMSVAMLVCALAYLKTKAREASVWCMPKGRLAIFAFASAVATMAAQKNKANLVYRSTMDSVNAVTAPVVGPAGTCSGGEFVQGKYGKALYVPVLSTTVQIPFITGLPAEKGCIEFWAKLEGDKATFGDHGDPCFFDIRRVSDSAFVGKMEFTSNDGSAHAGLCSRFNGVTMFSDSMWNPSSYGKILSDYTAWHHYALVWNADGIETVEGNPVSAVLVDGVPVTSIDAGGFNKEDFIATLQSSLNLNICTSYSANGQGVSRFCLDELRVWDSDVTVFDYAPITSGVRYVDASAPEGGLGLSWNDAVRTINEVSGVMEGGTIYVKPGVYAPFSYASQNSENTLSVVATGGVGKVVIDGNGTATIDHGGDSKLKLDGLTLRNLSARVNGAIFEKCFVSNNLHGVASASSFRNCLVVGNAVDSGYAVFDACSFVNSTVAGNGGNGVLVASGCTAANTIFSNGAGAEGYQSLVASNCCVEAECLGGNNTVGDPLFVDTINGDYRLADGSPCIDSGDNAFVTEEVDLAGNERVRHEIVDMGAFESEPPVSVVYHSTLDSSEAIINPSIGPEGICNGATFKPGLFANALYVPARSCVATIPFTKGLPRERGCIEFWAKIENTSQQFLNGGDPMLLYISRESDSDFMGRIEFNANDGGGRGGLGLVFPCTWSYTGRVAYRPNYGTILSGDVFDWHHYSIIWNVDGISALGGDTRVALMVDGKVILRNDSGASPWNRDEFLAVMSSTVKLHFSSAFNGWGNSPFSVDELKVWNADVITYRDFAKHQDVTAVYDGKEHSLGDPIGGTGDAEFQYSLSENGPFVAERPGVKNAGTTRVWYVQSIEGYGVMTNSALITIAPRPVTFTSASAEKTYDGSPLTAQTVSDGGAVMEGDEFSFTVTGSQTTIGESANKFTWAAVEGTIAANYSITTVFGTLKVTAGESNGASYAIGVNSAGEAEIGVQHFANDVVGDVVLPQSIGGLPVTFVHAGAFSGLSVTSVVVPGGVKVDGALFANNQDLTNVTFAAAASVKGALSFRGCGVLKEVVIPAGALIAPHSFLGCWALERVVFLGGPAFGDDVGGDDSAALLAAAARPASLLQMADMICYPTEHAAKWEKILRNLGYGGRYGAFDGEWTGADSLLSDTGNLTPPVPPVVTNMVVSVITNEHFHYSEVTNVFVPEAPAGGPAAQYSIRAGDGSGVTLSGAAGWDAFNLPEGMEWDKAAGALVGTPTRSGVYDVLLVSGSGAATRIMRTTIEVAGYKPIMGMVGVSFYASGKPVNELSGDEELPDGLTWKNSIISGVPSAEGEYSYVTTKGEPVPIEIQRLPGSVVGVFNGELVSQGGRAYPLKVQASESGSIFATLTVEVETYTLRAKNWTRASYEDVDGERHRMFYASLSYGGMELQIKVDADAVWSADSLVAAMTRGPLSGLAGTAQRNAFETDADAMAAIAPCVGSYPLVAVPSSSGWTLRAPPLGEKGALTATVKANGTAKLSGKLPDRSANINVSTTLRIDCDGHAVLYFYLKGAWIIFSFEN